MERKFIQPVWIKCESKEQQDSLIVSLRAMGYHDEKYDTFGGFEIYPIVCTNFNLCHNRFALTNGDWRDFQDHGFVEAKTSELFLALAAMSEGDQFWPEEWAVCLWKGSSRFHKDKLYKVIKTDEDGVHKRIWSIDEFGEENFMYLYPTEGAKEPNFRKATAEEIIAHFTEEERVQADSVIGKVSVEKSFFDQISGEADKLDYITTESLTELYDIAAEEKR